MPGLRSVLLAPLRHPTLFWQFLRREILGRYRGSMFGVAWAFITPLLMLGVYTLVFVGIFRLRWPGAEQAGGMAFALRLFAGLMVFNFFSEVAGRAASFFVEQPNLVKKVAFPLALLPFISLGSALFHFGLSLFILFVGTLFVDHQWSATLLLVPVVLLPLLPLLLGLSWLLASLGVFVRDIAPVVSLSISLLLFLSPIFYSIESLKPEWQFWMHMNPLTPVIENLRGAIFMGMAPDWAAWSLSMLIGCLVALFGARVFLALRPGFSDVL
ncbi:ABC transporter permease [Azonexus sp.]|uniref:ABC transporter permease n=1 Tax=Azonexus sp. TaxID=1872668 RepID=UPI0027B9EF93|nr:ABC transporter permease [Azonexus sp.]